MFQTAWEQTHDILLLSLAEFIFKACIWLLFCSAEGGGKWLPRRRVLDGNFSLKAAPVGSCLLASVWELDGSSGLLGPLHAGRRDVGYLYVFTFPEVQF